LFIFSRGAADELERCRIRWLVNVISLRMPLSVERSRFSVAAWRAVARDCAMAEAPAMAPTVTAPSRSGSGMMFVC